MDAMETIYAPYTTCFGDCWAFVNYACHLSLSLKRPVHCSCFPNRGMHLAVGISNAGIPQVGGKLEEMMAALDLGEAKIVIVGVMATTARPCDWEAFNTPYLPTKAKWEPVRRGRVCYQLDNNQVPEGNSRCLKRHHREAIMKWLSEWPGEKVKLGLPMTVEQCAKAAASSDLFVGMDSGMSHLCHSVGLPVLLADWPAIERYHPGKRYLRFSDSSRAIALMSSILGSAPSPNWDRR
jgi:hypothetical protein